MNRRDLLKHASYFSLATLASGLWAPGAYAAECATTDHLNGFIPEDANATVSSTGEFHHYHYLHIPLQILMNPPRSGFTTITSLMRPELGIDDFFFRPAEQRKQFHFHQVYISNPQLQAIAAGRRTSVTAFIPRNRPNHTFVFNRANIVSEAGPGETEAQKLERLYETNRLSAGALINEQRRILALAEQAGLRTESVVCDTRLHRGVSMFNSRETRFIATAAELERLKGY